MKKNEDPEIIKLSDQDLKDLQRKIENNNLGPKEKSIILNLLKVYLWLSKLYFAKKLSLRKLKRLFSFSTEKVPKSKDKDKDKDKEKSGDEKSKDDKSQDDSPDNQPPGGKSKSIKKGHGRNGKKNFPGAKRKKHNIDDLKRGESCPSCLKGRVYPVDPGVFIQFTGQAPISCTIHETEKLRCNLCFEIFEAELPGDLRKQKYDETADVSIAIQRFAMGIPHYRLGKWQLDLGIPLPASTQWERVEWLSSSAYPVFEYLKKLASNGKRFFIDDTGNKILDLKKEIKRLDSKRKGIYTTGIISEIASRTINLFFTGNRHAGENFQSLLDIRSTEDPIIMMSDALAANRPKDFKGIWCNCLTHARRGFYDYKDDYEKKVADVLHLLGKIYHNDLISKRRGHSPEERLNFHQKKSSRIIKKIRRWCLKMFYLKKVEPNEELGESIKYFLKHYQKLTQFLRIPGASLDNSTAERLIKTCMPHRKNSLFFKTVLGAYVGDLLMSLIQTARAARVNPFKYLLAIHRNKTAVRANPENWLPWNFQASF